jgi:uncharacterized membrane protein YoaK (UPF0700 family)
VSPFLADVRGTLVPQPGSRHGPLPPLLVALTFVTGLVDAFSYLVLGHVFVANMTGNVVFLGFALIGVPGFSLIASALALATFWCGAVAGGRIGVRFGQHRAHLLTAAVSVQSALLVVSVALAAVSGNPVPNGYRYPLIVVMAMAMGVQNATARKLAVPDLTTTVLTLTITGIGADSAIGGGHGTSEGRRITSVVAMFLGALVGAAFVVHVAMILPLIAALVVLLAIAATSHVLGRTDAAWVHP